MVKEKKRFELRILNLNPDLLIYIYIYIYIDLKFVALKNQQIELNAEFGWLELEVL